MLSCSIRFSVCGAGGAVLGTICTAHTTYAAAVETTTHPETGCRKPYAATQHLMLLMMGVCTRNVSSQEFTNKITLLQQVGISHYFTCSDCYWVLCGETNEKKPVGVYCPALLHIFSFYVCLFVFVCFESNVCGSALSLPMKPEGTFVLS